MANLVNSEILFFGVVEPSDTIIRAVQDNPVEIEIDAASPVPDLDGNWDLLNLRDSYSNDLSDFFSVVQREFTAPPDLKFGNVSMHATASTGINDMIKALSDGETLTGKLQYDCATEPSGRAEADISIHLRALKTNDYLLSDNQVLDVRQAVPLLPSGTPNLVVPAGDSLNNYQFYSTVLAGTSGPSTYLTVDPNGVIDLHNSVTEAPSEAASRNCVLEITNAASHSLNFSSSVCFDLHVPNDVVVLVDSSGSMEKNNSHGVQKFDGARRIGNLFVRLFSDLLSALSSGGSRLADENRISIARFYWQSGSYQEAIPALQPATNKPQLPAASPHGYTPIGCALNNAYQLFADDPSAWRRRSIVLITDGMHNSGTPDLADINSTTPGSSGYIPNRTSNNASGTKIHFVSFALTGETDEVDLHALATGVYDGSYHSSAADADPESSESLNEMLLDLIADMISVQRLVVDTTYLLTNVPLEDGIDQAVFVTSIPSAAGFGAHLQANPAITTDTATTVEGFTCAQVASPPAGYWAIDGTIIGTYVSVLLDLKLQTRFWVELGGIGDEMTVCAEVLYQGRPVSGAEIRVGVSSPVESGGKVLVDFYHQDGLLKIIHLLSLLGKRELSHVFGALSLIAPQALAAINPAFTSQGGLYKIKSRLADVIRAEEPRDSRDHRISIGSIRAEILRVAEQNRMVKTQYRTDALTLEETEPGIYKQRLDKTLTTNEGVYTFRFQAQGETPAGNRFTRQYRLSKVLAPFPSRDKTEVSWDRCDLTGGKVKWTATITPYTACGIPLGPLMGNKLNIDYQDTKIKPKTDGLRLRDNFDGSYSAEVVTKGRSGPPPMKLQYKIPSMEPIPEAEIDLPAASTGGVRYIKVILTRIKVLDDKDGCLTGAGELAFDAIVAPNSNPNRAVRKRLPGRGYYALNDGDSVEPKEVIFEGWVEQGATLDISIGGNEFDWFLFWERKEHLARYRRILAGDIDRWEGDYLPDDEINDPELLKDWALWYRVEVSSAGPQ